MITATVLGALTSAAYACATVADLDVTRGPDGQPERTDLDDNAAAGDAATDATTPGDTGTDAQQPLPAPPAVCACPADQACCVPGSGPGVCTSATGGATCRAGGGLFLRCAGGDIANGRLCCFTADGMGTAYAASCPDAGPSVCTAPSDCATGTCRTFACRGISLGVCAELADTLPSCPP